MPLAWGVIAQATPTQADLTDFFTCPAATYIVGRVTVTNRSAAGTTFRLALAVGGEADDNKQYLAYDTPIDGRDVYEKMVTMGPGDVLRVYATLATLTFTLEGGRRT
jgi:hypothetical protein